MKEKRIQNISIIWRSGTLIGKPLGTSKAQMEEVFDGRGRRDSRRRKKNYYEHLYTTTSVDVNDYDNPFFPEVNY